MVGFFRRWRRRRILRRAEWTDAQWQRAFARLPLLARLDSQERARLRDLAVLFLHDKQLHGLGTVSLTPDMKLVIALQACLPILGLDLSWYDGWRTVLVYPDDFAVEHEEVDDAGVVHRVRRHLAGEAWHDGPVILSWNDVRDAGRLDGYNLVVHEFAHKLDMRNGRANGFPPLHKGMDGRAWAADFTAAFDDFRARRLDRLPLPFDGYAAESPGEFFAVLSEVFFEQPAAIADHYPAVYRHLRDFYRQDPLARLV